MNDKLYRYRKMYICKIIIQNFFSEIPGNLLYMYKYLSDENDPTE